MATPRVNMKGFYKQKKKIPATAKTSKNKKRSRALSAAAAVDVQEEEYDVKERTLREFDMNMAYGPCIGMTRMERWDRAHRLGLNPPVHVKTFLLSGDVNPDCLWSRIT